MAIIPRYDGLGMNDSAHLSHPAFAATIAP
jgi:hypothetical protein